ncbi:MAG: flagellar assembly peptidoglycan hydrolase FlgJ [Xanthobacteraceae bacterium]
MTATSAAELGSSLSALGNASLASVQAEMKTKGKAKHAAEDFEAMFLNSMFQQMFTGIDGDGPFGGSGALKVWRSFLTDQYAKTFAKSGGIGIATDVYSELLRHQGIDVKASTGGGTVGKGLHGKGAYAQ